MRIRAKIVLVVLPVMVLSILLAGITSFFAATTGITRIASEFLDFKAEELERYAESQWAVLEENELAERPEFVEATRFGIENYAAGLMRSETENVVAFNADGELVMSTRAVEPTEAELERMSEIVAARDASFLNVDLGGVERVARGFYFEPFQWFYLVTEERETFYSDVNRITFQTVLVLAAASLLAVALLFLFSKSLTRPLATVVGGMRKIISDNDLEERVQVEYDDETGELAHTFNIMTGELDKAYRQIKNYAFRAVVSQKRESRIRNIFQKYVPQELIDRFYENPESMLVGENRRLSILFSDIRSFTSISEQMEPDDLVTSLNQYFSVMVDIIMNRGGVIDKYIGDAIMAFFGAPISHDDDALQSVYAGIEMAEGADRFNEQQRAAGRPEFRIGVGLNYGEVTVGNIGTDRKMDYTVIGDIVNLASRMEGLTKIYGQRLLFAESLFDYVDGVLPWRLVDKVAVKGKKQGVRIYTAASDLTERDRRLWNRHNAAMEVYYRRGFAAARTMFDEIVIADPDDTLAAMMKERCERYAVTPPPSGWDGVEIMESK